ncbi:MAG TPA: 23S rRNA (cytosine(1962)-C(5))-methyltransferase RlmI, partial [Planctomycetes bacterium]|nr:23S rRNA (cytosine(1962)-C(5))-methyltransferase RlmI [Planctomycetota bacterium]
GRGVLRGELPSDALQLTIDGTRFELELAAEGGQKTGMFLDQRENVRRLAELARGRRVLDACCYLGAFGVACARAGAERVECFDASEEAAAGARRTVELNEVGDRVEVRQASLYPELRRLADAKQRYDLIVLDPPKFAPTARDVKRASKGYLDANLMALKLLAPGGLLLTCSCSGHVDSERFEGTLRRAATRGSADLRVLERWGAGPDHPVDVHCPEGRYLKAFLLQRR